MEINSYIENLVNPDSNFKQYQNSKINMLSIPKSFNSAVKTDFNLLKSQLNICKCHIHHCHCTHHCIHHCHCHCHQINVNEILIPQQERPLHKPTPLHSTIKNIEIPKLASTSNIKKSIHYSYSFNERKNNNKNYDYSYKNKYTNVLETKNKMKRSNTCKNYDNIGYHYINETKIKDGEDLNKTSFSYGDKNIVNITKSQNYTINKSKSNNDIVNYTKIDKNNYKNNYKINYKNRSYSNLHNNDIIGLKELSKSYYFQPNYKKYVYGDINNLKTSMNKSNHKYKEVIEKTEKRTPIRSYYSKNYYTNNLTTSEIPKRNMSYIQQSSSINKKENTILNLKGVRNDNSPFRLFTSNIDINRNKNDNDSYFEKSQNTNKNKYKYNRSNDEINSDDVVSIENKYLPKKNIYNFNNDNNENNNYEVSSNNNYEIEYNQINNNRPFNQMERVITFSNKNDNVNEYEINKHMNYLVKNNNQNTNSRTRNDVSNSMTNNCDDQQIVNINKDYLGRYLTEKNYAKYLNKVKDNNKYKINQNNNVNNFGNVELCKKMVLKSKKKYSFGNKGNTRYVNRNNDYEDKVLHQLQKKFS